MDDLKTRVQRIEELQTNMQTLRRLAGWTVEELGNRIGVTKQTISNLESRKTRMSFPQYIALRAAFENEVQNGGNMMLHEAIRLLLDEKGKLTDSEYGNIKSGIEAVAAAVNGGAERKKLEQLFPQILGNADIGIIAPKRLGVGAWLREIFSGSEGDTD